MKSIKKRSLRTWNRRIISFILIISMMLTLIPESAYATSSGEEAESKSNTWMENDNVMKNAYIGLFTSPEGRFSIGTTGGNPESENDDNGIMLYGYDSGSTSYTTFRIDGSNYIYTSTKSVFDTKQANNISNVEQQGLNIKQKLSIIHNSATGREDLVEIRYTVNNVCEENRNIGCRIMMDTKLGDNDSAPFRIPGIGAVTTETEFTGEDIPNIWQAFDSLSEPTVIAQGMIYKNVDERPDIVQFGNWRSMYYNEWDYVIQSGSTNGDSAVTMTWEEDILAPGETREYVTYYGLSEFSQDLSAPLTLSLYSESELEEKEGSYIPDPLSVNAYIENIGNDTAKATSVKLELPKGLTLVGDSEEIIELGDIPVYEVCQAGWQVQAAPVKKDTDYKIRAILSYDNGSSKSVTRNIHVPATTIKEDVREVPKALDYTLFTMNDLAMSGYKFDITGNVYTGKNYMYSGSILDINGRLDAAGTIRTSGWKTNIEEQKEHTEEVAMPDLFGDIEKKAGDAILYNDNITFTEHKMTVSRSIRSRKDITFAGTEFEGSGYVISGENITCNVNQAKNYNDGKVIFCSENGNITLNGSEFYLNGILYAPNGTVYINAYNFHLKGRIIAKNIMMSCSQMEITGESGDVDYLFDADNGAEPEDNNNPEEQNTTEESPAVTEKGRYERTFTTDEDFDEGVLNEVSQRLDDALVLEYKDSDQSTGEPDENTYESLQDGTGFTLKDSLDKTSFYVGNEEAALSYRLTSFVDGSSEPDPESESYNYVAKAAGRKVLLETTLLHAENIDIDKIQPKPDQIMSNDDGSMTIRWQYDRLTAGDNFTYHIPLYYKDIEDTGIMGITRNTMMMYYDEKGDPKIIYPEDKNVTVTDVTESGTWEVICDAGKADTDWDHVSWSGIRPDDSDIKVYVSVSDDKERFTEETETQNGIPFEGLKGRYLKVRAVLLASTSGKTPELDDVTVSTEPAELEANRIPELIVKDNYEVQTGQPVSVIFAGKDDTKGSQLQFRLDIPDNVEKVNTDKLNTVVMFTEAGDYVLTAEVTDGDYTDSKEITFVVRDPIYENIGEEQDYTDRVLPTAEIADIRETDEEGMLSVIGTACDESELAGYVLTYRGGEDDTEHFIFGADEPVVNGELGTMDISELPVGDYVITLTVLDTDGNQSETSAAIHVEHRDGVLPEVDIISATLSEDNDQIIIIGTAKDETELKSYSLIMKYPSGEEKILAEGKEAVEREVLAKADTKDLESGDYTLELEATDKSGNKNKCIMEIEYQKKTDDPAPEEPKPEDPKPEEPTPEEPTPEDPTPGEPGEDYPAEGKAKLEIQLNQKYAEIGDTITGVLIMENVHENSVRVVAGNKKLELEGNRFSYKAETAGEVIFTATASDSNNEKVTVSASVKVYDLSDSIQPTIDMITPQEEEVLTKPTDIKGTAKDDKNLLYYRLDYAPVDSDDYVVITEGKEAVEDDILGVLDTTMMENGMYVLRLTAEDEGGNRVTLKRKVIVEGNLKVGAMNIGFTDITSKMGGTTVSVNRMYDSRNKSQGDFGYGWTLGMQGMEIIESNPISDGYEMIRSGSIFSTAYEMSETLSHDVVVTYGDGTSDRFKLSFSPQRQALVPISEVTLAYRCVTNQKVKLEIIGDTSALVSGTELYFNDDNMYDDLSYKLTTEDNVEVYINKKKGVYKIVDNNGNKIKVDKDGYHSEDGRSITFTRDNEDRVTKATDTNGNETVYAYDDKGDLISVTDSADRTVSFSYDNKHNLMSITDPMGVTVSRNEYDDDGRLIATIDADGNRIEYDHDVEGRTETVKDRRGNTTVYTYDDKGNVLQTVDAYGNKTTNTYDDHNNLLTTKDAKGNITSYEYDNSGNVTQVTAADGTKVESTYTQENLVSSVKMMDQTVMAMEYDNKGRISSIEDANGNETKYSYSSDGKLTGLTDAIGEYQHITYDEEGNVASTTNGAGESATYTYDNDGRVLSVTISREENGETKTFTSHYSYDDAGNITQSIDNAGNVTKYEYDANGNRTASVDAKARRITYEYDKFGNMIKTSYPDGTFEEFTYDANGNNITAKDRSGLTVSMTYDKLDRMTEKKYADGTSEKNVYDAVGNVTEMTSASGAKTTYAYDNRNRNTSITDAFDNTTTFEYDESARLTKRIDAKGNEISYEYDDNGNITKTTYADGNSVTSTYDARNRVISQKDQNGNKTEYDYDGADRLTKVTYAYGNSYCYGYDDNGNLITVTDANEHVTRYAYDEFGRVQKVTNVLGKTMEYTYDKTGNVTRYKDYAGNVTEYVYDDMDRVIKKTVDGDKTEYSYDDKGLLAEVTDKSGTIKYQYDDYNRLIKQTDVNNITLSYTYDEAGRIKTFDNGFGKTDYEYDVLDRVTKVIDRNGKATLYEYDSLGNRNAVHYPNGNVVTYEYDACNRFKEECITNASGVQLSKYTYGIGKAGERTSVTEINSGVETDISYKYDKLNRLTKETIERGENSLTYEYSYDAVSNRTEKKVTVKGDISELADTDIEEVELTEGTTTYKYNALNQLITEETPDGTKIYAYDDNGNLVKQTGDKTVDYSYDKENHLVKATIQKDNSVTIESYTYDYAGNRLSKTVNESDTTLYVNDTTTDLTQVVAETDNNGNETAYYTRGDELLSMEKAGEICYYLYDGHGNVRTLTNEAGRITDRYSYDAYGCLLEKEGDTKNEFLYTGEQYNANTGLYYLRARYMNPSTGTFISMDSYQGSIYDPVSLHKYLYANANPVKYSDPSGYEASRLDEQVVCLGIATILASAILFSQSAALNMFASLRMNMVDSVIELGDIFVTPRDWKDVFITFPSHNYDRRYITSIPTYLMNRHLFKYIYEVKEVDDDVDTPGVPDDEQKSGEDDTVTSNKGNDYDNKPSDNHSVTDGNPVKNQEPNSSVDIKDKNGNIVRRRWFDENGDAKRDLDYTNHGNPKEHPEVPHEHYWDWSRDFPRQ